MSTPAKVGFVTMGDADRVDAIREIGVGLLGYAFMGKAHANAYRTLDYMIWPPSLRPRLIGIAGRTAGAAAAAAQRYGFEGSSTDWRTLVADDRIQVFDNVAPNNMHAEPTIAAAEAGKHVICEKPLARTADESFELWTRTASTGVKHMCAFNYRFVPAIQLARQLIEQGEIGEIYHFRACYLQEWIIDPQFDLVWRLQKDTAGSGALGDLGAHIIDLARFLVGEIRSVSGLTRTFVPERPGGKVDVDDAFEALVTFDNGAIGTLEASRFCQGRKNSLTWEINGSKASMRFDLERLNELNLHVVHSRPGHSAQGFRQCLVSEAYHPYWQHWWPQGHMLGWEHAIVHELHHFLQAIAEHGDIRPLGADFEDGYRAAEVCDAILRSARTGQREVVEYRTM